MLKDENKHLKVKTVAPPQDSWDGIFCTVPRPHFLGRALIWPGCFGEHILGLFGLYSSSLSSLWDSFLYLGKLHWFLYLLLSYFYDPGMFIFRWSSNFVEKVVLNGSMLAKMASRVSYFVYYLSNKPHFLWVYRRDNPLGMFGEHERKLVRFTSFSRVLRTSQVG